MVMMLSLPIVVMTGSSMHWDIMMMMWNQFMSEQQAKGQQETRYDEISFH